MRAAAAQPGRLIDQRYRLQQPGGRCGPDQPWPGWDELLRRPVEITEIVAGSASPDAPQARRAARAAARLSHPAIARVYDVAEQDGSVWIVTEPVPGRPLDQVIAESGPLPPARAARLGRAVAGALAAAHAAGVTHGALTPSRVLLSPEPAAQERVVLAGFGALAAGSSRSGPGPRGGAARPAADMRALGVLLFTAVEGYGPSGRRPGMGVPPGGTPSAPSAGPLGPVISALLDPDPARRPGAGDAVRLLDAVAADRRATPAAGQASSALPGPHAIASRPGLPPAPDFASLRMPCTRPPGPAPAGRSPAAAAATGRARWRVWPVVIALPVAAALFAAGAALWLALAGPGPPPG